MKTTLPPIWHDLMRAASVDTVDGRCAICGAPATNKHHIVPRSAGKLFDEYGHEVKKPTIRLCGGGNASGCHGLAHHHRLHFRCVPFELKQKSVEYFATRVWVLEFLITDEPCRYLEALEIQGWRNVKTKKPSKWVQEC